MVQRLRTLLLLATLALVVLAADANAQATLNTYTARVVSADPYATPKPLFVAIVDAFSTADVSHDRESEILTIVIPFQFEQQWLIDLVEQAGFELMGLWLNGEDIFDRPVAVDKPVQLATDNSTPLTTTTADE
jgi:hypothetical protein